MKLLAFLIVIYFTLLIIIPILKVKLKGLLTISGTLLISVISSIPALKSILGSDSEILLRDISYLGDIPLKIDALSGWFILIINFTFITGIIYGFEYMKQYQDQKANLSIHYISYITVHTSLIAICTLQNSLAFLFAWEIMALSSFLLIIFEFNKHETLKAGINFFIQSHISGLFLMVAFIWIAFKMNSFDFDAITEFSEIIPVMAGILVFLLLFIGFAIKAGFVPFHTWLPYAHPACPSHISGVMSGVIIKIGIYGILRMILLFKTDFTTLGYIILFVSVISGVYGVMLAILQHNLKKLLAYHSIENIGIIGIGIGLGCLGLGNGNQVLTLLGFAGALLHTLNHSLFKSLLFYSAGNVYQSTHTMNIDELGGLGKKMPQTTFLFLIAALAICGLPPFNGFVSEFLIYSGMFSQLSAVELNLLLSLVFTIFGLVLIGGLAILCFTKATGAVFLGNSRKEFEHNVIEANYGKLIPMYVILFFMISIGIFPGFFVKILSQPLSLFTGTSIFTFNTGQFDVMRTMSMISISSLGFIILTGIIYLLKKQITKGKISYNKVVWGCGYVAPSTKMQYTATSFVRTYRKLAEPLLSIHKNKNEIKDIFPTETYHETHASDKAEEYFIKYPLRKLRHFINRFAFLQNGNQQLYILYGIVFIILILLLPTAYDSLLSFFSFIR